MTQLTMSMFANRADLDAAKKLRDEVRSADRWLTSLQLIEKYSPNGDGEHVEFTRADWRDDVADQKTVAGYWVWTVAQLEQAGFDADADAAAKAQAAPKKPSARP